MPRLLSRRRPQETGSAGVPAGIELRDVGGPPSHGVPRVTWRHWERLQALELLTIVTSDSFEGSFGSNGRLEAEIDIDGEFSGELFVRAEEIENVGCDIIEVVGAIIDFLDLSDLGSFEQLALIGALTDLFGGQDGGVHHDEEDFRVTDLSVTFDGTFDAVRAEAQLTEVDEVDADLGSISFDGDGFLDSLTNLLSTLLTSGCSCRGRRISPRSSG